MVFYLYCYLLLLLMLLLLLLLLLLLFVIMLTLYCFWQAFHSDLLSCLKAVDINNKLQLSYLPALGGGCCSNCALDASSA